MSLKVRSNYKFVFTGFERCRDLKAQLVYYIKTLDGTFYESDHFNKDVTHLVCIEKWPCSKQKFLGALSSSKWILIPEFIIDSYKVQYWLPEEAYEWGKTKKVSQYCGKDPRLPECVLTAPYRNRFFQGQVFVEWVAVVVNEDPRKRLAYEMILMCGGALIYRPKIPVKNPKKVLSQATHVFVEKTGRNSTFNVQLSIQVLQEVGCQVLSTDYIRNYLLRESTPFKEEFDIRTYIKNTDSFFLTGKRHKECFSLLVVEVERLTEELVKKLQQQEETEMWSDQGEFSEEELDPDLPWPSRMERAKRKMDFSSNDPEEKDLEGSPHHFDSPSSHLSPEEMEQREMFEKDPSHPSWEVLSEYRSQEDSSSSPFLKPIPLIEDPYMEVITKFVEKSGFHQTKYNLSYLEDLPNREKLQRMLPIMVTLFGTCIEENQFEYALDFMTNMSDREFAPNLEVLCDVLKFIMQNPDDRNSSDKICMLLPAIYRGQPGLVQFPHACQLYLDCLTKATEKNSKSHSPWDGLSEIITSSILNQINCQLFLKFFVDILETNFVSFLENSKSPSHDLREKKESLPLIVTLFWPKHFNAKVNHHCNELFAYVTQAIQVIDLLRTLQLLLKMVSLMAEAIRLSDESKPQVPFSKRCKDFTREMVQRFDPILTENEHLYKLFLYVEPLWLRLAMADEIMSKLTFLTYPPNFLKESLCLEKVVHYAIKANIPEKPKVDFLPDVSINDSNNQSLETRKTWPDTSPLKPAQINRKNKKGETQVHLACMRNDIKRLEGLLKVPGVQAGVQDHAGWTPLHEACIKGYLECVRLLMQWRPAKTSLARFSSPALDIYQASQSGVSALDDAIVNDHVEIVQFLLEQSIGNMTEETFNRSLEESKSTEMMELLNKMWKKKSNHKLGTKTITKMPLPEVPHPSITAKELERVTVILGQLLESYLALNQLRAVKDAYNQVILLSKKTDKKNVSKLLKQVLNVFGMKNENKDIDFVLKDLATYQNLSKHLEEMETSIHLLSGNNPSIEGHYILCFKMKALSFL